VHVRVHEREKIAADIASWIDAVPLLEPMSRFEIAADGRIFAEESR
jgi:hypothetical protein